MQSSLFRRGVAAAVALLAVVGMPGSAHADRSAASSSGSITDATGDATVWSDIDEDRADIFRVGAVYDANGHLRLTGTALAATNPATDLGWSNGGSGWIWVIDTDRDDTIDVVVTLSATGGTMETEVLSAETFEPVAGCQPTADFAAGSVSSTPVYSVTFDASCIGTPSTFAWGANLTYDSDPVDDSSLVAVDFAPNLDAPLAAGPDSWTDFYYDEADQAFDATTDPRADITAATAAYGPKITLTASVLAGTDPRSFAEVTAGQATPTWMIDTNGDSSPDYEAALGFTGGQLKAYVTATRGYSGCTGSGDFSSNTYSVSFDPACVGSPVSFRWSVSMVFRTAEWPPVQAYDLAPDRGEPMAGPVSAPPAPQPPAPDPVIERAGGQSGYWMITERGDVYAFGGSSHLGNASAPLGGKQVDIEPTPGGNGYWILSDSGAVSAKGDARLFGSAAGQLRSGEKAAALSTTRNGDGYWIFTDRGRVLTFGTARHFGDMSGVPLNGPVLDSVATPSGNGYWMVASDGGIFSFGDATFHGSMGNTRLNKPVMSMAADPDGSGYWLVASDGGIFAFNAAFYGSMGSTRLNKPISGIVPGSAGYLMVAEDGGIFAFGNVPFHGSLGATPPSSPVVAVALKASV